MSVTFCRLGRNVRFVLLLAWETLLPTCRPLPVSSQTRDMVYNPDFWTNPDGFEERRPLAARAPCVNVAARERQKPAVDLCVPAERYCPQASDLGLKLHARCHPYPDPRGDRHPDWRRHRLYRHQPDAAGEGAGNFRDPQRHR